MAKIDYNLIFLKSENARMSLKDMSHCLKKTPQRLKYSLSVYEKENYIRDPFCVLDYSYFGLLLFRVYFREGYILEQDKESIIKELSANPYIVSLYEFTGEFDLTVEFACPNPSKFNKELKKIATSVRTLNDYKIVLNLVTHMYPRNYLTRSSDIQNLAMERIIGGDRERESFNPSEMSLMKHLAQDPKISLTELAKRTGLNIKTAKSIQTGLKKKNVIKGFRYILDTNRLSINKCRMFLKLHNLNIERDAKLMEYLLATKEIVQANRTVGDWDMELDIESFDRSRIRHILMHIREEFKDLVERCNLIEFYAYYKRQYLPQYLFKADEPVDQQSR